ncbi:MAG: YfhO family protein [Terrimicrobiaceae bacterium]
MLRHLVCLALLMGLVFVVLGPDLFSWTRVLSSVHGDVALQYLYTRQFSFGEMALGNIPLWNPYLYGGVPCLGDFQNALLYPPNWTFLVLPIATAINWSFAIHVFLLGAGMYFWAFFRGLGHPGSLVAGAAAMLGGTFFPHLFAGHLSNICTMAWVPFVFLGIDGWLARRHAGWIVCAAAAVALQVYAGNPQYTYFCAMVAATYALLGLWRIRAPKSAITGLLIIYPLGFLLSAAQLLPGLDAASESVRAGGTSYAMASQFSYPPENFLTLFSPWVFGKFTDATYWGRWYLWETSAFLGSGFLLLAICGIRKAAIPSGRLIVMLGFAVLLALGANTPLHRWLFDLLPGFGLFRGASKFGFFAGLFVALLAGAGVHRLLHSKQIVWEGVAAGLCIASGLLFTTYWLASPSGVTFVRELIDSTLSSGQIYYLPTRLGADAATSAGTLATENLWFAAWMFAGFATLIALAGGRRWVVFLLAATAILECGIFARSTMASFDLRDAFFEPVAESLRKIPGDYRVFSLFNPNAVIALRKEGIWGYEPSVLRRYARLVRQSQRVDPDDVTGMVPFVHPHPVLDLLRCRFALVAESGRVNILPTGVPFPRFFLANEFEVLSAGEILSEMKEPFFNMANKVLLEEEPVPRPEAKRGPTEIRHVSSSTDHQTIEILTPHAAILVITDSYSKDWKVRGMPGSAQINYRMIPANYALRAVPLSPGRHVLRMEYIPKGLGTGILFTVLSLAICTAAFWFPSTRKLMDFQVATA